MAWSIGLPFRSHRSSLLLAFALGTGLLAGCGSDDDNNGGGGPGGGGGPTATTFTGVFANDTENGSLSVTINSTSLAAPFRSRLGVLTRPPLARPADIPATGVLKPIGGSSVTLTGSYNDQSDSLHLANLAAGYAFAGIYDTTGSFSAVIGQYVGPNGIGFFGAVTGSAIPTAFCGTFDSDVTATGGNWDLVIAGGEVGGIAFPTGAEPFAFEGTIETSGTMRDITAGSDDPGVYQLTVTGTLDMTTNTVSGTWTYEDLITPATDSGTWSGSPCP